MAEGIGSTEGRRPRLARGRPNWWVILAVSLALMALLVATAGNPVRAPHGSGGHVLADAQAHDARNSAGVRSAPDASTTTTSTVVTPPTSVTSSLQPERGGTTPTVPNVGADPGAAAPVATTTTTVAPTTTTTVAASHPSDIQSQGVIEPPQQRSSSFGFNGTGAMEVSVTWSGDTYLTMEVNCPSGSQSVGGSSAMAASLPDASGSCLATVSEPTSESAALTYTITIGPAGG
ncbi:MAG TPA: hypothetical protein VIY26_06795 [Acidimicrobiales bacterium]